MNKQHFTCVGLYNCSAKMVRTCTQLHGYSEWEHFGMLLYMCNTCASRSLSRPTHSHGCPWSRTAGISSTHPVKKKVTRLHIVCCTTVYVPNTPSHECTHVHVQIEHIVNHRCHGCTVDTPSVFAGGKSNLGRHLNTKTQVQCISDDTHILHTHTLRV